MIARWFAPGLIVAAACGTPQITVSPPLGVINFAPQDGATNVDPAADEGVCFNKTVDATNLGVQVSLVDANGAAVSGLNVAQATANGSSDPYCLDLSHPRLNGGALYQMVVPQGLAATDKSTLAAQITSRFRTTGP